MNTKKALNALNQELNKIDRSYTLYICGGAALQLLGIIARDTIDVDVIADQLEKPLIDASLKVAKKLRIADDWLNNKVNPIASRLSPDWKEHCIEALKLSHLTIYSLCRQDLINAKLHAATDRRAGDISDLVDLKPTLAELAAARKHVLKQNDSETYSVFVDGVINLIKKDIGLK
jgi:hypothetical protein